MEWECGPILHFRGAEPQRIKLAAVVVSTDETPLALHHAQDGRVAPELIWRWGDRRVWRYDFALPRHGSAGKAAYGIGSRTWDVALPGQRLRAAFTACNGKEEDDDDNYGSPARNVCWRDLMDRHARDSFHLLLQGGDQMYADDVWQAVEELAHWRELPRRRRLTYRLTAAGEEAVADFYFSRYCRLWRQHELAAALAHIPSLMMWDDHDIFDGWGSHKPAFQACPVYQAVWRQARRHFMIFQLGRAPRPASAAVDADAAHGHFGWAHRIGDTAIVAPDLRSERTRQQVMGAQGWRWLDRTLDEMAGCRRLLFVSSVPVINVNLSLFEKVIVGIPGQQQYQDDLRDQWCSYAHRREWRRLVDRLLAWTAGNHAPVTILSGEIHLAARGRIERRQLALDQLISSGIVHPAPPAWLAWAYDWLAWPPRRVMKGTRLSMLRLPGVGRRYLSRRNWLALTCNADATLDARWRTDEPIRELPLRL